MSGAQGAASAEAIEPTVVDDGFTAEERQQFEQMMQETPPPPAGDAPPAADAPAAGAEAGAEAPAADEADDDGDDAAGGQQPTGQDGKPAPRRVNYNKFKRMEDRALAAERDRDQFREQFQRTDERIKLLNEALTPKQEAQEKKAENEDPEPDPEKDVFGWIQWSRRKTARLEEMVTEQRTQTQSTEADRQIADSYIADATRYAQSEPNFVPAYNFLMQSRTAELALYFFDKDLTEQGTTLSEKEQQQILAEIAAEEKELVQTALKSRKSPAQAIYKMARTRGYRPQAAPNGGAAPPAGGAAPAARQAAPGSLAAGDGGAPAAAARQAAPNVAEEISRIKAGTEASKSLSQGGGAPPNPLTPEKLANMSQDEFSALMDTLSPAEQRRLMGG